ncbi:unnamed protein product [Owenia fusiformis]|uniref:Uncharacterized protein n=1 Tax=Owenia fusiformis TaxID=6347 RepID=A0A8J1XIT1_OWEFU|nr:unnamed protein product [Owenia fusiformis]
MEKTKDKSESPMENGQGATRKEHDHEDIIVKTTDEDLNMYRLLYNVEDTPEIGFTILAALQQAILSMSGCIIQPLIIVSMICASDNVDARSQIVSTSLCMAGLATIIQCTFGVRLPIIQGGSSSFFPAIAAIMALEKLRCKPLDHISLAVNSTGTNSLNMTIVGNASQPYNPEMWKLRASEISGCLMMASLVHMAIGASGILGLILKFVGPLTITPVIALVGLSLTDAAYLNSQSQWGIAFLTAALILLFAVYLGRVKVPVPSYNRKEGCTTSRFTLFSLIAYILGISIAWGFCGILTVTNVFPDDPNSPTYNARTDARVQSIKEASWFFFPYPGQFGRPTFNIGGFVGILAAVLCSIVESVADYNTAARICDIPPPPQHAINRGILIEGIASLISGAVGVCHATTSYSGNISAIGITRVGSRIVFQLAGGIILLAGMFGKFGAVMACIPDPVLGGSIFVSFSLLTALGLSSIRYVDMRSTRNHVILGTSLFGGLMSATWMKLHPGVIKTGSSEIDQLLDVFFGTAMFVGGTFGFVLDNTVPGTPEERGLVAWRQDHDIKKDESNNSIAESENKTYDLPLITPCLKRTSMCACVPFLPSFEPSVIFERCRRKRDKRSQNDTEQEMGLVNNP